MFRSLLCLILFVLLSQLTAEMSQQAYVWQRDWTRQLESAIEAQNRSVDGFTVLYGEADPSQRVDFFPAEISYPILKASKKPVTLALRLNWNPDMGVGGAFESGFSNLVLGSITRARENGLEPAGIEIDFDCPTSKLDSYADQLSRLRKQMDGLSFSITTLPTWMTRPKAFKKLVHQTDYYVLQVHSIKRADRFDSEVALCDVEDSLRWIKQAATFGQPYLVALPTYGYRLAYNEAGELVEVAAEDAVAVKNPDWRYRVIRAEPDAMAEIVQKLQAGRPKNCMGIIWYRLPIGGERLNWDPVTWHSVMQGKSAEDRWQLYSKLTSDGAIEIEIVQNSKVALRPPSQVIVSWEEAKALAWDGQRNFSVSDVSKHGLIWKWPEQMEAPLLPVNTRWTIGWLRMDTSSELQLSLIQDAQ